MKLTRFEEIDAWKEARKFVGFVYDAINQNEPNEPNEPNKPNHGNAK